MLNDDAVACCQFTCRDNGALMDHNKSDSTYYGVFRFTVVHLVDTKIGNADFPSLKTHMRQSCIS